MIYVSYIRFRNESYRRVELYIYALQDGVSESDNFFLHTVYIQQPTSQISTKYFKIFLQVDKPFFGVLFEKSQ